MTVREIKDKLGCKILAGEEGLDNQVEGGYCGDLLSWVMGRAEKGDAWITVMGNINAIGVAVLTEISCIILSESASLDKDAELRANQQGVPVLQSDKNSFNLAVELSALNSQA